MLASRTAGWPAGLCFFAAVLLIGAPLAAADDGEAPGRAGVVGEAIIEEETLSPAALEYWRASADTFVSYDDDNTWVYGGGGCIYRTGGTNFFDIDLQLPDGVEITFLRVYYYDNDGTANARAILYSFDGAGGFTSLAEAESSGTPGWSPVGVALSHIVNTTAEALAVRLNFLGATTADLQICGVRVQYDTP